VFSIFNKLLCFNYYNKQNKNVYTDYIFKYNNCIIIHEYYTCYLEINKHHLNIIITPIISKIHKNFSWWKSILKCAH